MVAGDGGDIALRPETLVQLFEELATDQENTDRTKHDRIYRSKIEPPNVDNVLWAADRLIEVARAGKSPAQVRKALFDVLGVLESRGSIEQIGAMSTWRFEGQGGGPY